jgi:hypothetical protein
MEGWKKEANQIQSRCGFCDAVLFSWEDRVDHLTRHFKREGKTMADWKGDWGFEPHVLEIVENAMPPCKLNCLYHVCFETKTHLI